MTKKLFEKFSKCQTTIQGKNGRKIFYCIFMRIEVPRFQKCKKKISTKLFRVRSMDGPPGSTSPGNISGTDKDFDMRFFANAQKRLELHSDQLSSKSLEPFLRKVRKTPFLTGFSPFSGEPVFFSKIRLCHFLTLINV